MYRRENSCVWNEEIELKNRGKKRDSECDELGDEGRTHAHTFIKNQIVKIIVREKILFSADDIVIAEDKDAVRGVLLVLMRVYPLLKI